MEKFKVNAYFDEQGESVEKVIVEFLVKNIDYMKSDIPNKKNIDLIKL